MSPGGNKTMTGIGMALTLSVEIAIAVIVPILIGRWLDSRTGKGPWFTLAGMILGGAAAIRSAYRTLKEWGERRDDGQDSPGGDSDKKEPRA
jgi:F0F1-type ATP synthase assembly protein I